MLHPMLRSAFRLCVPILVMLMAASAQASPTQAGFREWLSNDLWPEAERAGISRATFDAAFKGVSLNLKLPDLVLPGSSGGERKQHQAEFRSPGAYFAPKSVDAVVNGGRSRLNANSRALSAIKRKWGVPGPVLLAVWGRESGFGAAKMPHDAFEVLGTKAFLATRKAMFREELLAALRMVEDRHVARSAMRSSWAGALGQPQFLPTSFLRFAEDGDGDGKVDIWNSTPDTLASIAHYLASHGWQKGRDWGFEVEVPQGVSCALEGPDRGKTFAEWEKLGVVRTGGRAFPRSERSREGFLLMPAGRSGPAFIVTPNFYVIKEYNESDLYALFIGHGADRIGGAGKAFAGRWQPVEGLLRSDVAGLQRALEGKGYDVGGADGLPGFRTRRSIGEWEAKAGRPATCYPSADLVRAVR
ncbi:MAG: lytic murein transglycosylase [Mesorhizobium amorphae]|nr:MAG: lytic murein transglycosylase [Mesorhizobium amorphae]